MARLIGVMVVLSWLSPCTLTTSTTTTTTTTTTTSTGPHGYGRIDMQELWCGIDCDSFHPPCGDSAQVGCGGPGPGSK